ncbi:MAG: hypothetical protein ACT4P1_17545 [Sporichthyaceae bacterium]
MADLAEALFCSPLQPSEALDPVKVRDAVAASLRCHHNNVSECAEELAERYGKDPEGACLRMRWARATVAVAFPAAY